MSGEEQKEAIAAAARELGFGACGVAAARPAAHADIFRQWVAEGKFGDMAWLGRDPDRRSDPRLVVPGARAVVVLAINYFQGGAQPRPSRGRGRGGTIARYAWNDDYHDLVEPKLKALHLKMEEMGGEQRYYVDTGPVLERDFASEAGVGWGGKSTVQIDRRLGTWFFLAVIITTLDLPPDAPQADRCGRCTRCIEACPTGAITAPRRLDPRLCISYLTIEHKGPIPEGLRRAMGDRIYGCDDCLDACPWNRFAAASREAAFAAREEVFDKSLRDLLALDDGGFRALFKGSPIRRTKRPRFLRNVCVALGNVGTRDDLPALRRAAGDPDPLVAEHAEWAIGEIEGRGGEMGG